MDNSLHIKREDLIKRIKQVKKDQKDQLEQRIKEEIEKKELPALEQYDADLALLEMATDETIEVNPHNGWARYFMGRHAAPELLRLLSRLQDHGGRGLTVSPADSQS